MSETFALEVRPVRSLGYRDAEDRVIFQAARAAGAVVVTEDSDFVRLLERYGPPPHVLWITLGNTSNAYLKAVLTRTFAHALALLGAGEALVEISERRA